VAQTLYTHVNKCKNDKIKERKKKRQTQKRRGVNMGNENFR
jgi:hypothetical protein